LTLNPDEFRMPIMEHLRELRTRLMISLGTLIVAFFVTFGLADEIFAWLAAPMLAVTAVMESFLVQMRVAGYSSVFIGSPVIFFQAWKFVAPGLYDTEKRWVLPLVTASTALFIGGAAFAYLVLFRYGFPVFLTMNGENVTAVLSIESYLNFAATLLVAFGVSFQLPIVVWFLARLGLIDHIDMIRGFRYSIVGIVVIAGILTPPDVFSQMLMAIPLVVLYAASIVVARVVTTKKREPAQAG
jgi:sec-independent protein translocase protein TatC